MPYYSRTCVVGRVGERTRRSGGGAEHARRTSAAGVGQQHRGGAAGDRVRDDFGCFAVRRHHVRSVHAHNACRQRHARLQWGQSPGQYTMHRAPRGSNVQRDGVNMHAGTKVGK